MHVRVSDCNRTVAQREDADGEEQKDLLCAGRRCARRRWPAPSCPAGSTGPYHKSPSRDLASTGHILPAGMRAELVNG